jgi:hypothetical protein
MAQSPKLRPRTKHINLNYHHFRDAVEKGEISIHKIDTNDQIADIFTKALPLELLRKFRHLIMGWDTPDVKITKRESHQRDYDDDGVTIGISNVSTKVQARLHTARKHRSTELDHQVQAQPPPARPQPSSELNHIQLGHSRARPRSLNTG